MNSYFRHFEVMRVFIEHNEQFEIQGVKVLTSDLKGSK